MKSPLVRILPLSKSRAVIGNLKASVLGAAVTRNSQTEWLEQ